jgi:hypothetical protein
MISTISLPEPAMTALNWISLVWFAIPMVLTIASILAEDRKAGRHGKTDESN